jgi:hypothetical protein
MAMFGRDLGDQMDSILDDLADGIDFTERGLGQEVLDVGAVGIAERSLGRQSWPDGRPWEANEPRYAASKGNRPIGVLTGEMLSLEQLKGTREITPRRAVAVYGTTQDARDKGEWFTTGGRNSVPRGFYETDAEIDAAMFARIEEGVVEVLRSLA